jgi:dTDP-4-amino-4,6-dideoxygalactose transaminase
MPAIPRYRPDVSLRAVTAVLTKAFFETNGRLRAREFEVKFADYIGVPHALYAPSGRMALYLLLKHLRLPEKSQIILSSFTYWAVPSIISFLGLEPVFIDIDPETCNMDVAQIRRHITSSTKAIVATHLYGLPCFLDEIKAVADEHNLIVVEDCVQACGAEYKGRKAGSWGDAAYFSFGITKNMPLLGGGMVTVSDDSLADSIRGEADTYTHCGKKDIVLKSIEAVALAVCTQPYFFSFILFPLISLARCFNSDFVGKIFDENGGLFNELPKEYFTLISPAIQADMALAQLADLDARNNKRIKIALQLRAKLKEFTNLSLPPPPNDSAKNIFTKFPIRCADRDSLIKDLLARGIDATSGYMKAHGADCPYSAALEQSIVHIPMYSHLNERDVSRIDRAFQDIYRKTGACN